MRFFLIGVLLIMCSSLQGQKRKNATTTATDTLVIYKDFIHKSNLYKQLPLYLEMKLVNSANFITAEADTLQLQGAFYLKPGIMYIRFGDVEQFVGDSIALMVSDKLQRIIVYTNAQPLIKKMQVFTGAQWSDSSLQELAKRFSASSSSASSVITLTSRNLLFGTQLPKEQVEMQYDPATQEPVKVATLKRTLLPITEENFKLLQIQGIAAGQLLTIEGRGQFLIKEQTGSFMYKTITHNAGMNVPASITDRIVRNDQGIIKPAKAYEHYVITLN